MFASFLNKSASFFTDMSLADAGYNCQECQDKGCCPICRSPPCDGGMVVCSDRTCKKWYHLKCENVTDEFIATVKTYYCVSCRQNNSKRKIVKYKKSEIEAILNNLKSQKSEENIQKENISSDLSCNDAEASSDFSEINEESEKASILNASVDASSSNSDNELSEDSSDEETSDKQGNSDIPLENSLGTSHNKDAPREFNNSSPIEIITGNIDTNDTQKGGPSAQELNSALDTTFPQLNTQVNKIIESGGLLDVSKITLPPDKPNEVEKNNQTIDLTNNPSQPPQGEQGQVYSNNIINPNKNCNIDDPEQPPDDGLNENINKLEKLLNSPDEDIRKKDRMSSTPHPVRGTFDLQLDKTTEKSQLLATIEMMKKQLKDAEEKNIRAQKELEERDLTIETLQLDIRYKTINHKELEEHYNILEERLVTAIDELKEADLKVSAISKEPKKVDVALLGKKHPKDLIRNFIKLNQLYYAQNRLQKEQKIQLDNSKIFIRKLTKDKAILEEKITELTKEDINRKVLNFTMDENLKLTQELKITRQRLFTVSKESPQLEVPSDKDTAWESITDTDDDEKKDEPPNGKDDSTKNDQPENPNNKQNSLGKPTTDPTVNENSNAKSGSDNSNPDSASDDRQGRYPNDIRSRTWTASGRGNHIGDKNSISGGRNTDGLKSNSSYHTDRRPYDRNGDRHNDKRPRSWTGQSNQHKAYHDKRKNIPCKFAISGRCRYTDRECFYYHPKEHQMAYYRGSNWIPSKPQTANQQQKETISDEILRNMLSLNNLLKDQIQKQQQPIDPISPQRQQVKPITENNPQQYQQSYPIHSTEGYQNIGYDYSNVTNAYNHLYDPNLQLHVDQNTAPNMYNSLTHVNQTSH